MVTDKVSPVSTSESFDKTPLAAATVKVVSSFVEFVSKIAKGVSLIGFTVKSNVLFAVLLLSDMVYVTWGTVPLKLAVGVNT